MLRNRNTLSIFCLKSDIQSKIFERFLRCRIFEIDCGDTKNAQRRKSENKALIKVCSEVRKVVNKPFI